MSTVGGLFISSIGPRSFQKHVQICWRRFNKICHFGKTLNIFWQILRGYLVRNKIWPFLAILNAIWENSHCFKWPSRYRKNNLDIWSYCSKTTLLGDSSFEFIKGTFITRLPIGELCERRSLRWIIVVCCAHLGREKVI